MSRITVTSWNGLESGDVTTVNQAKGTFKFLCAVIDTETGETLHISMYGGPAKKKMMRAFYPNRVNIPSEKELQKQRSKRAKGQEDASDA